MVPAALTRTGVFTYRRKDGTVVRELRHPDDVFDEESLKSLRMAPLTDDHPNEFVTPENFKKLTVGYISEKIDNDGRLVTGTVVVSDKKAIAKADNGKVELSCGYIADLANESGVFEGQPYDLRQKNIRYNHVALVDRGRAGHDVRLRMDSEDAFMVESENKDEKDLNKEEPFMKIKIGDQEFEVSKEVADAFNAFTKKQDEDLKKAEDENAEKKADLEKKAKDEEELKKKNDALQARVDHLEKEMKKKEDSALSKQDILKAVRERKRIEDVAEKVLGSEAKLDQDDLELMKAVILKDDAEAKLDGQSETYIKGRFDALESEVAKRKERADSLGQTILKTKDTREDKDFDSETAKTKMHADAQEAWKQPLAAVKK